MVGEDGWWWGEERGRKSEQYIKNNDNGQINMINLFEDTDNGSVFLFMTYIQK